jgi:HTH-type transcriptional regulator/antitoxin HipB
MEIIVRDGKQMATALRRIRRLARATQTEVAASAGVRQATVSDIENGSLESGMATVYKLLAALDLELVLRPRTKAGPAIEDIF